MAKTAAFLMLMFAATELILQNASCAPPVNKMQGRTNMTPDRKNGAPSLSDRGLFEGDLRIGEDIIRKHYDLTGTPWESKRTLDNGNSQEDDKMSAKQKTDLSPGSHKDNRHYDEDNASRSGDMIFNYGFIAGGIDCAMNPCLNGGTCVHGCPNYICRCPSSYVGTNCDYLSANLNFFVRNARQVSDRDVLFNESDPYMVVVVIDAYGNEFTKKTSVKSGTLHPDWYEWLEFGTGAWKSFSIRIYDSDDNEDDALSVWKTGTLSPGSHRFQHLRAYGPGEAWFDYYFTDNAYYNPPD